MRTSRGLRNSFYIALLALLSACAPDAGLQPLPPPASNTAYRLGSGDQVRVTTFDETGLTGQFTVDDSGNIAMPLLGPVSADGLTTTALAHKIATTLKDRKLLADPNVVVEVVKYRPIFVLGEVQHPGPYPFQPHMTLLSAVALAGGFTPRAVEDRASVVRSDSAGTIEGRVERQSQLEPGDVVTVLERNF